MAKGKEVHLFDAADFEASWSVEYINRRYAPFFESMPETNLWGEATPIYLYWSEIIPALKRYNPALKLIVLLRDPAERAISHYEMEKSRGNESLPLWLALLKEPKRLAGGDKRAIDSSARCHSYTDRGFYARQLNVLREHFGDSQILIMENEELRSEHATSLKKVCDFLQIDASMDVEAERVFSGSYEKKFFVHHWLVNAILHWRFRRANQQLKKLLNEMGLEPQWSWLR
jgi:hypothetical protein